MSLLQLVYASFLHARVNTTDIKGEGCSLIFSTLIAARQKIIFLESLVKVISMYLPRDENWVTWNRLETA